MTGVLSKRGNLETDLQMGRMLCEHEVVHLQAEGRGLGRIFSSPPSEETSPAGASTSDLWPPRPGDNTFLLFKPLGLGCLVMAA